MTLPIPIVDWRETSTGIAYIRAGAGDPLVLLHGGAGSWTHWALNIEALAARFTVLALDLPGYGASFGPARDIAIDDYLAIIRESVREICGDAGRIHLSGFSFGALVATALAGWFEERVTDLSLIGASGFEPPTGRQVGIESLRVLRERLGREPEAVEICELHRRNLAELMIWDAAKIDRRAIELQAANVAATRFDSRRLSWSGRMPEFMACVRCPARMLFGEHDRSAYPSIAGRIEMCRAVKPEIEIQILEDCGHWAMYEAPQRVNAALIEFHGRHA